MCFNRVCREIRAALPFNKISTIADLHKLIGLQKLFKSFKFQIGAYIEIANAAIVCNDG